MYKINGLQAVCIFLLTLLVTASLAWRSVANASAPGTNIFQNFDQLSDIPAAREVDMLQAYRIKKILSPDSARLQGLLGGAEAPVTAVTEEDADSSGVPYPEVIMVVRENGRMSAFLRSAGGMVQVHEGEAWMDWRVEDIQQTSVNFWSEAETFGYTAFAPTFEDVDGQ